MIKLPRKTQPIYIFIDLLLMAVSFFAFYAIRHNTFDALFTNIYLPSFKESCFIFILWAVLIVIAFKSKRLYDTDRNLTIPKELLTVITRVSYTSIIVGSVIFFAQYKFFSRFIFFANFMSLCILLGGWRIIKRLILRKLIRDGFRNINILIVGTGEVSELLLEEIKKRAHLGFKVVGFLDEHKEKFTDDIPILGKLSDFHAVAKKYFIDEVIVTMSYEKKAVFELVTQAQNMRLGVRIVPDHLEKPLPVLDISFIGIIPMFTYKIRKSHPSEATIKRIFDLVTSLILIILLFFPFIIIAVVIKIDSSGPVFFIQKRVGFKGKIFNFCKFRSMVKGSEKLKDQLLEKNEVKDGVIFKIKEDPRTTSVGKFLRKYSLDELPQLFNVLKGNMSLVGPRPPLPTETQEYTSSDTDRLSIKPGITGLPQIRGRSDLSFARWVKWDLWYINNWSFWLDIKILLWTIPVLLKGKGAY